ncbi:MAG: hypothetical protein AB1696_29130 [Planctomycetota bacterium]
MEKRGFAIVSLLIAMLVHPAADGQTTVRGTVKEEKTGKPIANLTVGGSRKVVIEKTPNGEPVKVEKTATTDANGEYVFELPAGVKQIGVFTLSSAHVNEIYDGVQFQGAAPSLEDFKQAGVKPVDASADAAGIDFLLDPLGAKSSMAGKPARKKKAEKESSAPTKREDAYYTDTHGAAGVLYAMLSLGEGDDKYMDCAHQTLAWLMHVKKTDDQGRATWYLSDPPALDDPRAIQMPGVAPVVAKFLDAYARTKRPEYKETGLAGARWLAEVGAVQWETPLGAAHGWPFFFSQRQDQGLVSGHSHGLGKYIQILTHAHAIQPDEAFVKALKGILVNLKTRAVTMDDGALAWPAYKWSQLEDKSAFITGYCYGQAGVIIPLLDLAEAMPDLKLSDGTTPLLLANSALRYLMSQAEEANGGYRWPWMRNQKVNLNPGLGSGVGGIGWAFLKGYQVNRKRGDEKFAQDCMKHARGAAEFALRAVESATEGTVFASGGGPTGFGVCGGAGGSTWFPRLLAEEIGKEDPKFLDRTRNAMKHSARLFVAKATPVGETLAWKMRPGEKTMYPPPPFTADAATVNMALDYGQTGVVLALAETGKFLKDDEVLAAARKAADFIVNHAVKTEHGWKFARFVSIEAQ